MRDAMPNTDKSEKVPICIHGRELSLRTELIDTLILDISALRTVRSKSPLFQPLIFKAILLQHLNNQRHLCVIQCQRERLYHRSPFSSSGSFFFFWINKNLVYNQSS